MILEGIVSSEGEDGAPHAAPMGPRMPSRPPWKTFELRPFTSSTTWANLCRIPRGVLHVTDDPLVLARSALGMPLGPWNPACNIAGWRLADACRWIEFEIVETSCEGPRGLMAARVVAEESGRPFFGFNRANHAVLEAAILATRLHLIPAKEILLEIERLRPLVVKTGGEAHHQAFALIEQACRGATVA
jgi:hypothetical protein